MPFGFWVILPNNVGLYRLYTREGVGIVEPTLYPDSG